MSLPGSAPLGETEAAPNGEVRELSVGEIGRTEPNAELVRVDGWLANYGHLGQNILFETQSTTSNHVSLEASRLSAEARDRFARNCQRICRVEIVGRIVRPGARHRPYLEAHELAVIR